MVIDWRRIGRPQLDGYDTKVLQELAALATPPYEKRRPREEEPSFFDGAIRLQNPPPDYKYDEELENAPFDHRNLKNSPEVLAKVWPEYYAQMQAILDFFEPILDRKIPDDDVVQGCTSGASSSAFGGVVVTVNSLHGLNEGLVHEVGHLKGHIQGIHFDTWDRLIDNPLEARYDSPIRKDILRPMGAVWHAQYSYLHVLDYNIRIKKAGYDSPTLPVNYQRMREGRQTLDAHLQVTEEGAEFFAGINEWTDQLFADAEKLLA